MAEAKKGWGI